MLTFLVLVLVVGALIDVVMAPESRIKRGTKPGWLLAVLLLPVVGGAAWFAFGRSRVDYGPDGADDPAPRPVSRPALPTPTPEARPPATAPPVRPKSTEEQLAELEAEIAYWDERARREGRPEKG